MLFIASSRPSRTRDKRLRQTDDEPNERSQRAHFARLSAAVAGDYRIVWVRGWCVHDFPSFPLAENKHATVRRCTRKRNSANWEGRRNGKQRTTERPRFFRASGLSLFCCRNVYCRRRPAGIADRWWPWRRRSEAGLFASSKYNAFSKYRCDEMLNGERELSCRASCAACATLNIFSKNVRC